METRHNLLFFHFIAFLTVAIWGTTFVSTKVLMLHGLSPAQIFTLRFSIAYVLMLCFSHTKIRSNSWKDEGIMALLGITGGSLYFLSENESLNYTTTTNTSLIVCSCPLIAMLLVRLVYRSTARIHVLQMLGSFLAFVGMIIVVLNGRMVLHLSPRGDTLAITACFCWAIYSLLMKSISTQYDAAFITRKVFFYGTMTILPYYLYNPHWSGIDTLLQPTVIYNLLYLSCLASTLCFLSWNWCIAKLGAIKATNWVYFNPITTIIFAAWILNESITPFFLMGASFILIGMYIANKHTSNETKE